MNILEKLITTIVILMVLIIFFELSGILLQVGTEVWRENVCEWRGDTWSRLRDRCIIFEYWTT